MHAIINVLLCGRLRILDFRSGGGCSFRSAPLTQQCFATVPHTEMNIPCRDRGSETNDTNKCEY